MAVTFSPRLSKLLVSLIFFYCLCVMKERVYVEIKTSSPIFEVFKVNDFLRTASVVIYV